MNEYLLERMVHERLEVERARTRNAARAALAARPRRPGRCRNALGHALIRLGQALAGEPARRARHA